jgi:hypothetical protein
MNDLHLRSFQVRLHNCVFFVLISLFVSKQMTDFNVWIRFAIAEHSGVWYIILRLRQRIALPIIYILTEVEWNWVFLHYIQVQYTIAKVMISFATASRKLLPQAVLGGFLCQIRIQYSSLKSKIEYESYWYEYFYHIVALFIILIFVGFRPV